MDPFPRWGKRGDGDQSEIASDVSELLRTRITLSGLLMAAGAIVCASTLFGLLGRFWWFFDLFSHFRVQYFLSISIIAVLLLIGKKFRVAVGFGLCAAINLASILPYYFGSAATNSASAAPLRAVSINVNTENRRFDLVRQFIHDHHPDVVLMLEVDQAWVKALEELHSTYPYQKLNPREDYFGIALYSKLPFTKCDIVRFGRANTPSIVGEFEIQGKLLTIIGTHLPPPAGETNSESRNNQINAIAETLATIPGPKILMGDLNMTPWSYHFGRFTEMTGIVDSSKGRGLALTWPANQILLRIPIDHCLVSKEIAIKNKYVGDDLGSDHFPIVVDLALAE